MERYQRIEKNGQGSTLGAGTYGVVYKAKDRHTDEFVAMKVAPSSIVVLLFSVEILMVSCIENSSRGGR